MDTTNRRGFLRTLALGSAAGSGARLLWADEAIHLGSKVVEAPNVYRGGPAVIDRYDRSRNITFEVELSGMPLGDVPSASAILDRFLHRAEVVQITGKSFRLEKHKKSSNDTKAPTGSKADD